MITDLKQKKEILIMEKDNEKIFENVERNTDKFILENKDRKIILESGNKQYDIYDIHQCVEIMLDDTEQFVVLCAPEAIENIRYVQAISLDDGTVPVQIGIETKRGTTIYVKICDEEECFRIFEDFFLGKFKPDMNEFKPVKF